MIQELLQTDLIPHLEGIPLDLRQRLWFQQEGFLAHTSRLIRPTLMKHFLAGGLVNRVQSIKNLAH